MYFWNVLHTACWKYRMQKLRKNRHLCTIAQLHCTMSSQLRHASKIAENLLSSNISSTCPHNMVSLGPLTAEIDWRVCGTGTQSEFCTWQNSVIGGKSPRKCTYTVGHKKGANLFLSVLRQKSTDFNVVFTVRFWNERYMWMYELHPPYLIKLVGCVVQR